MKKVVHPWQALAGGATGSSKNILTALCKLQGGVCAYCGEPMVPQQTGHLRKQALREYLRDPRRPTIDHVMPISAGGSLTKDNLVAACHACNELKSSRDPVEFWRWMTGRPQHYPKAGWRPPRTYKGPDLVMMASGCG